MLRAIEARAQNRMALRHIPRNRRGVVESRKTDRRMKEHGCRMKLDSMCRRWTREEERRKALHRRITARKLFLPSNRIVQEPWKTFMLCCKVRGHFCHWNKIATKLGLVRRKTQEQILGFFRHWQMIAKRRTELREKWRRGNYPPGLCYELSREYLTRHRPWSLWSQVTRRNMGPLSSKEASQSINRVMLVKEKEEAPSPKIAQPTRLPPAYLHHSYHSPWAELQWVNREPESQHHLRYADDRMGRPAREVKISRPAFVPASSKVGAGETRDEIRHKFKYLVNANFERVFALGAVLRSAHKK